MKEKAKLMLFIMFFIFIRLEVFADEIHLIDGKVLKGKILKIDQENIEFDPVGDKPFLIVPLSQVKNFLISDLEKDVKKTEESQIQKTEKLDNSFSQSSACISSCLIPFWSGSLNYGYDNMGLFFSISKFTAFSLTIYSFSRAMENILNTDESWMGIAQFSGTVYILLVVLDMFYSINLISEKNLKKARHSSLMPMTDSKVFLSLSQRPNRIGQFARNKELAGMDLAIGFRF